MGCWRPFQIGVGGKFVTTASDVRVDLVSRGSGHCTLTCTEGRDPTILGPLLAHT